ncbi:hypothetical protein AVEN_201040-1 [Araneus ventricosus]|uniref:Uncharacterized protein n=1 Tax=Araneus ventricosus TaxID=182803 RepID=A0A4Y2NWD9_ARAVE|nr:hypothetical protein AVEN_201040-1 [Araneus ventricosus]
MACIRVLSVDQLERLSFVCSASWKTGELRAIENAVIVVISDLMTVCVAKYQSTELLLPLNCCLFTLLICARSMVFCYLCYVFSCIFVNKSSFSIILHDGLFTPYTHRTIFVTIYICIGSDEELENPVTTRLTELAAEEYDMGILKLVDRNDKCLNVGGDYVENSRKLSVCNRIFFPINIVFFILYD